MLFWILAGCLALLVTAIVVVPLLRGDVDGGAPNADLAIYKAQLSEVERDLQRGIVDPEDAERTRVEISRRLLDADRAARQTAGEAPRRANLIVTAATALVLIGGTGAAYLHLGAPGAQDVPLQARIAESDALRANRMSQVQAEGLAAEDPLPVPEFEDAFLAQVDQLRTIVPDRPDDLQGWTMLARVEMAMRNPGAAARALERVIVLKGADATAQDYMMLANQMIAATRGYISPEAESILRIVLETDPTNIGARYYYGQLFLETDRPDRAFRLFRDVINQGRADDPFVDLSRALVEEAAFRAGVNYTLPPERGPTLEDIEAASDLSDADRLEMIRSMVSGLEDRLANEGGTVDDWARLISSLGVLGDTDHAEEILREARSVFGAFPEAMEVLDFAAEQAGLGE